MSCGLVGLNVIEIAFTEVERSEPVNHVHLISLGLVYRFGGSKPAVKTAYKPYVAPAAEPMYKEPIVIVQAPVVVAIEPPAPAPKPWVKVKLEADSLFGFDKTLCSPMASRRWTNCWLN